MVARHTEQKRNVFRRMHVAAIKKLVDGGLTLAGDSKIRQFSNDWQIGYEIGQKHLAEEIRAILGAPPKGYSEIEPTLKTKAKNRYLAWREMQAKGEWKKLSEEEQARWEAYVTDGLEFGTIREKELERGAPLKVGDRVEIVRDIYFLGKQYRPGLIGEVRSLNCYDGTDVVTSYSLIFNGAGLPPVNAYPHEIKKASNV